MKPKIPPHKKVVFQKYLKYSQLGFTMAAFVLICGYLGHLIDEHFRLEFPWFMVGGIVFGFVGFLVKLVIQYFKKGL